MAQRKENEKKVYVCRLCKRESEGKEEDELTLNAQNSENNNLNYSKSRGDTDGEAVSLIRLSDPLSEDIKNISHRNSKIHQSDKSGTRKRLSSI